MTRTRRHRVKQALNPTVETALRPRLMGSEPSLNSPRSQAAQPLADLFPLELEAALDRTVAEFHAREPAHARKRN